jgi:putative transposase
MPIRKIQFKKGKYYHIYNRGNGKKDIFNSDSDRKRFLQSAFLSNNSNSFRGVGELEKNRKDYSIEGAKSILKSRKIAIVPLVEVCAFCLMPDHFHFLLREKKKNGIAVFMQKLGNSFGKYYSKKYGSKGNVFAGRYKTAAVENDGQIKRTLAYINIINPAQLVEPYMKIKGVESFTASWEKADNYIWSSHFDYLEKGSSGLVDRKLFKKVFVSAKPYNDFSRKVLFGKEINSVELSEKDFKKKTREKDALIKDIFGKKNIKII